MAEPSSPGDLPAHAPSVTASGLSGPLADRLRAGLTALGLSVPPERQALLLDYLGLIQKWTRVYNLTAVRDPDEMFTHHLMDSLAVVPPLQRQMAHRASSSAAPGAADGPPPPAAPPAPRAPASPVRLLDVGAGAGLPGVVIAICCPELEVDCVDTVAKKAAFIQQVAVQLKLPNLRGLHARVERLTAPYDVVCSRAFASLADFVTWSAGTLAEGGVWLAMKGRHPEPEIAGLPPGVAVFHVEPLRVPGLDAERCIVWLKKTQPLT